ncbi:MAG: hypothetical protein JNK75_08740 [Betaproteobacteria bacterium]|nr:hypothetical protein [Betaproteobacteria bacterium]
MKRKLYALALVAALPVAAAQAQSGIAFISDLKGDVTVDAGKASLMAELKKGAKITCARECLVGVMYLVSGREFLVKGPGDYQVGDSEVSARIGPPPAPRETKWKVSSQVVAQAAQTSSASIRMRSLGAGKTDAPPLPVERLIYPRDTKVATLQPGFKWTSANAKGPFEFELKAAGNTKAVHKSRVNVMQLDLPKAIKLAPDTEYSWTVKQAGMDVGMTSFKTLPPHALEVTGQRKPDDKAPFSDWLLYALTLKEVGADQDAGEVWARLAKERPDLPELAALAK